MLAGIKTRPPTSIASGITIHTHSQRRRRCPASGAAVMLFSLRSDFSLLRPSHRQTCRVFAGLRYSRTPSTCRITPVTFQLLLSLQNDQHASLDPRCKREEWAAYGIDHRMLSYWQDLPGQDSLCNLDGERQFNKCTTQIYTNQMNVQLQDSNARHLVSLETAACLSENKWI